MRLKLTFVMKDGQEHSTTHEADSRKAALDFGVSKWRDTSGVVKLNNPSYDVAFLCADIARIEVEEWD